MSIFFTMYCHYSNPKNHWSGVKICEDHGGFQEPGSAVRPRQEERGRENHGEHTFQYHQLFTHRKCSAVEDLF